jgi:hypothetical protein
VKKKKKKIILVTLAIESSPFPQKKHIFNHIKPWGAGGPPRDWLHGQAIPLLPYP